MIKTSKPNILFKTEMQRFQVWRCKKVFKQRPQKYRLKQVIIADVKSPMFLRISPESEDIGLEGLLYK